MSSWICYGILQWGLFIETDLFNITKLTITANRNNTTNKIDVESRNQNDCQTKIGVKNLGSRKKLSVSNCSFNLYKKRKKDGKIYLL